MTQIFIFSCNHCKQKYAVAEGTPDEWGALFCSRDCAVAHGFPVKKKAEERKIEDGECARCGYYKPDKTKPCGWCHPERREQ
jgi:hypothetical protein